MWCNMDEVDKAAVEYLHKLLSPENQDKITAVLRQYQAGERGRMEEFNRALQKHIREKQGEYDALMKNLFAGPLPTEVVTDIGPICRPSRRKLSSSNRPRRPWTSPWTRSRYFKIDIPSKTVACQAR